MKIYPHGQSAPGLKARTVQPLDLEHAAPPPPARRASDLLCGSISRPKNRGTQAKGPSLVRLKVPQEDA
eukprot:1153316-Pelagomonas_calceolata.AAC.11